MSTSYDRLGARSDIALSVENLLNRYPDLDKRELDELIALLPALSLVDKALMTADDRLSEKLAELHHAHGRRMRAPVYELVGFLAFPVLAAVFALAWILL